MLTMDKQEPSVVCHGDCWRKLVGKCACRHVLMEYTIGPTTPPEQGPVFTARMFWPRLWWLHGQGEKGAHAVHGLFKDWHCWLVLYAKAIATCTSNTSIKSFHNVIFNTANCYLQISYLKQVPIKRFLKNLADIGMAQWMHWLTVICT